MVEATGQKRATAQSSMLIRAAMMGAEAVVESQEDLLPGLRWNSWRVSGQAIRAVDDLGRQQLLSRSFEQQVRTLFPREVLLLLCSLGPLALPLPFGAPEDSFMRAGLLITMLLPALFVLVFRLTMLPQLLIPTAILCLWVGSIFFTVSLGSTVGALLGMPSDFKFDPMTEARKSHQSSSNCFSFVIAIPLCAFGVSLCQRLSRLQSVTSRLGENSVQRNAFLLRCIGKMAYTVAIAYACIPTWMAWRSAQVQYSFAGQSEDEAEAGRLISLGMEQVYSDVNSSKFSLGKAAKLFDTLAGRYPDRVEFRLDVALCHSYLGVAAFNLEQYSEARREFEVALRQLDRIPIDRRRRVDCMRVEKQVLHALVLATGSDPNAAQRDLLRMVDLANRAIVLDPRDSESWRVLGMAQLNSRSFQPAVRSFQRAEEYRGGGDSSIWFGKSMAHALHGDRRQARLWFDKAVEWMNSNRPTDQGLMMLRSQAASVLEVR
jgi:tetratricopeptide (TPR) repeat protein